MSRGTVAQKRVDPVIRRYVSSDEPLALILQESGEAESPLVQAILYIDECLHGKRFARDAIAAAQAVAMEDYSGN